MARIRRLVLDVLKPHHPDVVEFGCLLAEQGGLRVRVSVLEVDERTETVRVEVAEVAVEGVDDATD